MRLLKPLPKSHFVFICCHTIKLYSEPSPTSKVGVFANIVNSLKQLNISTKTSILDISLGFEYTPVKVDAKHQFNSF